MVSNPVKKYECYHGLIKQNSILILITSRYLCIVTSVQFWVKQSTSVQFFAKQLSAI